MLGGAGDPEPDVIARQRGGIVVRAAQLRWGSVLLSLVMVRLTLYPAPLAPTALLWITLAFGVLNVPLLFANRVSERTAKLMAIASVTLDFLVATAWTVLTVNDPTATTYVVFMLVAAEAGLLFQWRGTVAFIAVFVPVFAAFYVFRTIAFHYPYHAENHVFRTGIVCLLATIIGSLSNSTARLFAEVEKLSLTDPLTALGNRRAFDRRLAEEVERAKRYGLPLSLAIIDIDHFKIANDTHGHTGGDEILRGLGRLLADRMIRRTDVAYRYGGEEFAVIMPETDDAAAAAAVARMHDAVRAEAMPIGAYARDLRVSISVGVTSGRGPALAAAELVEQADSALYSAKESGRNRTVVYRAAKAAPPSTFSPVGAAAGS
ncbi:MAG TPA: GGDEF domain-containing protein [Candidatus Solibacter sp.]|jgi:diguanylate cyclase (GGDEF)-like protein|nr:GGDEF domain-containing protein [Candidatus Solibacter sp.]